MKRYCTLLLSLFLGAIVAQPALALCDVTPANTILPTGQSVKLTAACGVGITNINWKKDGTTIAGDVAISGSPTSVDFQIPTNLAGSAGGTPYVFSATANTGGVLAGNTAQVVVLAVGTAPTAPTTVTAAAGVGSISVAFSGGSLGSGSIVNYAATCGAYSASGMSSPIIVGGVANGAYTCTVTVTTTVGSATSAASNSVTVSGAASTPPTAPTSVVATAGYASLSVAFSGETLGSGTLVNYSANCGALTPVSGMTSPIVVTAVAGTAYTCTVTINTTAGSATSGASNAATPVAPAVPSAPTALSSTPGNTQLSIAFTPGALNGGTLVSNNVVCTGPSSYYQSRTGASPVVMDTMVNGNLYTCWVRTTNNVGDGAWSAAVTGTPSAPVPPTAMTTVVATAGYNSISVAFSGGTLGSGTLTNYTANCDTTPSAPVSNTGSVSPIAVTAVAGSAYTCTVTTTTSVGTATSAASNSATPLSPALPGAPTSLVATPGNTQLSIAFTPGALNGGTLTSHEVVCTGPSSYYQSKTGGASPIVMDTMINGNLYTCWARTLTNIGYSFWSSGVSGTPSSGPTVPGAPTIGVATAANASISVTFSAPGSNGGAAIDSYRATCNPGGITGTAASSPVPVSGLANGTAYTCTVAAHNSVGWGAESAASNSATPQAGTCGPGETFPIAGTTDAVWSGFNGSATYPSIGGEFASLGTSGVALQFVAGSNRGVTLLAGFSGSGTTGSADVTISTCPHAYTTTLTGDGGTSWQCTRTGMTDLQNVWVSVIGNVLGNECLLTNGQTYYLNIRPNNGVAISKQLGYTIQ